MEDTTMKKTYISPIAEVVKLNVCQNLLIGSAATFDDLGGGSINLEDDALDPGVPGDEVLSTDLGDITDFDNF